MRIILEKPVVTEKSSNGIAENKYTFLVNPDSNKLEVKEHIESFFKVKVASINMMNVKGKKKRRGRILGQRQDKKKAIVTLKEGEKIDSIQGLA